jgi:hypothetical protein
MASNRERHTENEQERLLHRLFDEAAAMSLAVADQLDAEPEMARFLHAVKSHPEQRAFVVQLFIDSFSDSTYFLKEPTEFLSYCMFGLRWNEVRDYILRRKREDVDRRGSACSHIWNEILDVFEGNWQNAVFFEEYAKNLR